MHAMSTIEATVERRILLNYRLPPDVAAPLVPAPFRLRLVGGAAVVGVCLIRLGAIRPAGVPAPFGITTENAAHRIAVEWGDPARPARGVYIVRRDTTSRLTALAGGRLFPGFHHHARMRTRDDGGVHEVRLRTADGTADVVVRGSEVPDDGTPRSELFASVDAAAEFFASAKTAYAATPPADRCDGLELQGDAWRAAALEVEHVESAFYGRLPGAVFDSALVMRSERSRWRPVPPVAVHARPAQHTVR